MAKTTLSILVHGHSGHGKSRLAASAPPPVLVIDLEGRAHYLPYQKVYWDPDASGPPAADGTWTHCIVKIYKWAQLERVKQWLESGQHPFVSVDVDSVMEAQKRFIEDLAGVQQLKDYDWGTVLRNLEGLVRDLRDLVLVPTNPVEVVVFITGTKVLEQSNRSVPLLQGQLRDTLPYLVDAVGFLYLATTEDGTSRNMLVQPTPTIVASDKTDMLGGPIIANPDLTAIWNHIKEQTTA